MSYPSNEPHIEMQSAELKAIFERIVAREEEKREVAESLKNLYHEAKDHGFEPSALKEVVKAHFIMLDAAKKAKAEEKSAIAETYARALQLSLF